MADVNLTKEFEKTMLNHVFPSFAEFEIALHGFENRTNTKYSKRNSQMFRNDPTMKFMRVDYCCFKGRPHESRGTGMRQTATSKCSCIAKFTVRCTANGLKVVSGQMEHNHPTDEYEMSITKHKRLLTLPEKEEVSNLIQYGYSTSKIKEFCEDRFSKRLTTDDVSNLRRTLRNSQIAYINPGNALNAPFTASFPRIPMNSVAPSPHTVFHSPSASVMDSCVSQSLVDSDVPTGAE
ncbi:unnamed protein product [Calicophoron daubneyi]|uniref:ZSWIM3 N-terminal domain-containing protein n=1 Tax=Calicophoron daubneyi TaxID=300641 RepID=A0AAV2TTQ2_CALDB